MANSNYNFCSYRCRNPKVIADRFGDCFFLLCDMSIVLRYAKRLNDARDFIDELNWRMVWPKKDSSDNVLRADVLVAHMYAVRNDIKWTANGGIIC